MADNFWQWAQETPDRPAVIAPETGKTLSYRDLAKRVNQLSHRLQDLGIKPGDGVAVMIGNEPEWLEALLAAFQVGAYFTPVNFHLTGPEVAYILANSEAEVFIASDHFAEAATQAVQDSGFSPERAYAVGKIPGFQDYERLLAGASEALPAERSAGMLMLYTSGTTGRPKGVRRPLVGGDPEAMASMFGLLGAVFQIEAGEGVHLVTGPLYHTAPGGISFATINMGQTQVLMDKWDALETLRLIERYQVTSSHMVATMFHRLLKLPEDQKTKYNLASLQTVVHGAAPTPPETKRQMIEWWGPVFLEYYGGTEGGGATINSADWLEHPGSVGKPFPFVEVKILDEAGQELPTGDVGEIWCTMPDVGPLGSFEYYKDPEKTAKSQRNGMMTLGDMGYFDDQGWLFISDRKSDMVISGGVNIYPAEIEAVLLQHPAVRDAAVFGVPDPEWGESVKAVLELNPGYVPSEALSQDIHDFAQRSLARYKLPRSIDYTEELPRSLTGKLYKRRLRDQYWQAAGRKI